MQRAPGDGEAGIKESKGIFASRHLPTRHQAGIALYQELVLFAQNLIRLAPTAGRRSFWAEMPSCSASPPIVPGAVSPCR
ncbi:MAG: hypothetical protein ACUVWR_07460 [Anaerolineae bacterium]